VRLAKNIDSKRTKGKIDSRPAADTALAQKRHNILKVLLLCGILSSLLYVGMDILCSTLWAGYSYTSQAISELSAIGAPTRSLWIVMTFIYAPLLIAFGIGVWASAGGRRSVRITGILLSIWGALGFVWLLFPMHLRGSIGSATDTMHLVMSAITVLLITTFIAIGSGAGKRWFRIYSILTILVMLTFGAYVGTLASRVQAQLPTPGLGIIERVSVFSPMLWVVVLAIILMHENQAASRRKRTGTA
jgi:hypothetical protein